MAPVVGDVKNSGWIASMDKIIFTSNSQKKLGLYSPNGWGYGHDPLCLSLSHAPVRSRPNHPHGMIKDKEPGHHVQGAHLVPRHCPLHTGIWTKKQPR